MDGIQYDVLSSKKGGLPNDENQRTLFIDGVHQRRVLANRDVDRGRGVGGIEGREIGSMVSRIGIAGPIEKGKHPRDNAGRWWCHCVVDRRWRIVDIGVGIEIER